MNRFFIAAVLLFGVVGFSSYRVLGAPADGESATHDETTDSLDELSSLERMQQAAEADVNQRYGLLNTISPRGTTQDDRQEIVQLLIQQLSSDYPDIRARTARVLGLFGSDAAPAIPKLLELLGDEEPTVSLEAVWVPASKAVAEIGPELALDPLMASLDETFQVRIERAGPAGEYETSWGNRVKYYGITAAIAAMGEAAQSTAPVFIDILRNGPENRRWATMFLLAQLGEAAEPAIPDYIKNLDHPDFNMKVIACRALSKHGSLAKDAAPKLVELMGKKHLLSTRTHAAMCLGAIGPLDDVESVALFKRLIDETNAFSQERGLIALGRLGEHARYMRSYVIDLLEKPGFSQLPEAARTLWQITGETERTLQVLERLIDNPTYDTRVYGVLKEMGPAAAPMAGALAERLETDDQSARQIIVEILGGMEHHAVDHAGAIRAALVDAAPDTAVAIDRALAKIEAASEQAPTAQSPSE